MTLALIIGLVLDISMFLIVFAIGLNATLKAFNYVFRHPGLLIRSLVSMNVVMPAAAIVVTLTFDLDRAIKIALVALSLSPVPPLLPSKQAKAGGSGDFAIGLLSAMAIAAIGIIPISVALIGQIFDLDIHMPAGRVAAIIAETVLAPLGAGIAVQYFAPELAKKISLPLSSAGTVLLVVAVLPILVKSLPGFWALVGNGVVISLILFSLVGLAVGHFLGGPDPDNRTVLALATATRHPAIAMAIAAVNFPDQKAVGVVLIWYLIIGALVSAPYVKWRTKLHAAAAPLPQGAPAVPRSWGR